MIQLKLPIYWQQTKKKRVLTSINAFRNWHYFTQNKFKAEFNQLVVDQLKGQSPVSGVYEVVIDLYFLRANCDGSNIFPLQEKVILDALVSEGYLEGDSVKYHVGTTSRVMGKDTENPRCEITVKQKE